MRILIQKKIHTHHLHDANVFAMMWKTKTIYQDINKQRIAVDHRFTKNVPQWKAFDILQVLVFLDCYGFLLTSYSLHYL